jgi:hypothetical protein
MQLKHLSNGLFLVFVMFLFALSVRGETTSPNYGFKVSIFPEQASPGVYQAKFAVTDLNTDRIVSAPTIRFRAGQPAQASAEDGGKTAFKFSVSVNESGSVAEFKAEALKDGATISRSQGTVSLNISGPR